MAKGRVLVVDDDVATNGFWSALTMATTLRLPMVFYIEDNGYGISVPGHLQDAGLEHRREPRLVQRPAGAGRRRHRSRSGPRHSR